MVSRAVDEIRREFAQEYDLRRRHLLRALCHCTGDADATEEITQEAFFRLYQHRLAGGAVENAFAWILTVARNLVRDRARKNKREASISAQEWEALFEQRADTEQSSERLLLDREARERMRGLVESLPEPQRSCVRLYGQGLNFREIAEATKLPYHLAPLQTRRGLERIKRCLLREQEAVR